MSKEQLTAQLNEKLEIANRAEYFQILQDLENISANQARFIYSQGICKVGLPITFYTFKANMEEKEALLEFIQSLDAVGSFYFNYETQKALGLIATTQVIKDFKPNAHIEKVS